MNQSSQGRTVPFFIGRRDLLNRINRASGFTIVKLLAIITILVIGGLVAVLMTVEPAKTAPRVDPVAVSNARQDYFAETIRKLFGELRPDTHLEISLGRHSNRVVLSGKLDDVSLPKMVEEADRIDLDFYKGHIVVCHFAGDREISRLYLVEQVKSLVWEAYFEKAEQWLPIYVENTRNERPSKIRLAYQLEDGSEKTEIFPVAVAQPLKIAAVD